MRQLANLFALGLGLSPRSATGQQARSHFSAQRNHHMPDFSSFGPPPTGFLPVGPNLTVPQNLEPPSTQQRQNSLPVAFALPQMLLSPKLVPRSFDYSPSQNLPFSLPVAYAYPQVPSTPHAMSLPLSQPLPMTPCPPGTIMSTRSLPVLAPLTPVSTQPRYAMSSSERLSGRTSRPLIPTVEPFQPASLRKTNAIEKTTVRSDKATNTQISGSPMPYVDRKAGRPLRAQVAPFEPSSHRISLEPMITPAEESEIMGYDSCTEWSVEQLKACSYTPFLEEDRLEEAARHFSNMQLHEPNRETVRVKQLESGRRQYLFSQQSNLSTPRSRLEQKDSPGRSRRLESVNEDVVLTVPAPVYHAHQEMVNPTFASESPTSAGYDHGNSYGSSISTTLGGPAMTLGHHASPFQLTAQEIEMLDRAVKKQNEAWLKATRIEKERIEMEDKMVKIRAEVQRSLEERRNFRLEREGYDYTRSEVLARDHQRRDEYAARAAKNQLDFDARIWQTFHPFWSLQPPYARFPDAHTQASNPDSQGLVSMFEVIFSNMADYRPGYTNYRPLHVAPSSALLQVSLLPRHRPSWIPGPTSTVINWDDPSICDNAETCRNIRRNACFVPYMEPSDVHRPPHAQGPCIGPLIGQENLLHIRPVSPDFMCQCLQDVACLPVGRLQPHQNKPSARSTPTQLRRDASSMRPTSKLTNVSNPQFKIDPPRAPSSMVHSQTLYPVLESQNSYNSPSPQRTPNPMIWHQGLQSPSPYRNTPSSRQISRHTIYRGPQSANYCDNTPSPVRCRNQTTYLQGPQSPGSIEATPSPARRRRRHRKK